MTDFLDAKRAEITARLSELEPLVNEHTRLLAAAAALDGLPSESRTVGASSTSTATRAARGRRAPGRPRKQSSPAKASVAGRPRAAGRRKGSGKRGGQAVELIAAQPGIPVPELAARMGIKSNYLYRLLPQLENEGRILKDGRGWKTTEQTAA